jgi:sec-independent protein translocase protein TatA
VQEISPMFPGIPGYAEVLILGFIVLLLFGKRLPSVMRSLGSSIVEFKKGVKGIDDEVDKQSQTDSSKTSQV